jgi:hypothetical protein
MYTARPHFHLRCRIKQDCSPLVFNDTGIIKMGAGREAQAEKLVGVGQARF